MLFSSVHTNLLLLLLPVMLLNVLGKPEKHCQHKQLSNEFNVTSYSANVLPSPICGLTLFFSFFAKFRHPFPMRYSKIHTPTHTKQQQKKQGDSVIEDLGFSVSLISQFHPSLDQRNMLDVRHSHEFNSILSFSSSFLFCHLLYTSPPQLSQRNRPSSSIAPQASRLFSPHSIFSFSLESGFFLLCLKGINVSFVFFCFPWLPLKLHLFFTAERFA